VGRRKQKWWRIWKLKCPYKVKHFWWGCAHNSLATRDNLIRRGIAIENTNCLFCNHAHEEGCHLFVKCKEVKLLRRALVYESMRQKLETSSNTNTAMDVV
jgi:hypothetical protein